jgi:ABC-2 type transport system permease protein
MLAVIIKELKLYLSEKGSVIMLIGMPMLFIVLFSSVFGQLEDAPLTIYYVDQDQSSVSKQWLKQLDQPEEIKLEREMSADPKKVAEGEISSLLVIPKGFGKQLSAGKQAELRLYIDEAADQAVVASKGAIQAMINQSREIKIKQTLIQLGDEKQANEILQPPVLLKEIKESAGNINSVTRMVPGYTVMFVFFITVTMIQRFFKDKRRGMVSRIQSTSLSPVSYLMGMWIPNIIFVMVQCIVLFGFGYLVYDVHLGDLFAMFMIILCISLCGTGLGLALSVLVNDENQGMVLSQVIAIGGAMVGGLWVPEEMMPRFLQIMGKFFPQYWAQQSLLDVMARGAHLGDIWPSLLVLFGIALLTLLIAWFRFPSYLKAAAN